MTADAVAGAIGRGLLAGFAGTAAMTVSSTLEARLRGRRAPCRRARPPRSPPSIFWGTREIAIDAFHHAVYAGATGVAHELIGGRR
jgi:hypothetical protein